MERHSRIVTSVRPKLRQPAMVCGISGWVDGGEAATGSIQYLVERLGAKKFAELPIDEFHVFQIPGQTSLRPLVRIEDGTLKEHSFPQNQFFYYVNPNTNSDLILFLGTEPNLHWQEYTDSLLSLAEDFGVTRIYLLGGVLDKTPHTKEPSVSCACNAPDLKEEMRKYGVQFSNYEGPGSFATTLLYLSRNRVPMISLTARATYYPEFNIIIPHNPKTIRAIMRRLNHLLRLNLRLSDLDKEAEEFAAKFEFMASHNPEFRAYTEELEKDYTGVEYEEPLDLSADEAVQIAEELLKRKRDDPPQSPQ